MLPIVLSPWPKRRARASARAALASQHHRYEKIANEVFLQTLVPSSMAIGLVLNHIEQAAQRATQSLGQTILPSAGTRPIRQRLGIENVTQRASQGLCKAALGSACACASPVRLSLATPSLSVPAWAVQTACALLNLCCLFCFQSLGAVKLYSYNHKSVDKPRSLCIPLSIRVVSSLLMALGA